MKFIYLIQSNRGRVPYHIPPGSDVCLLQWQEQFQPHENSFHYPNSTWASGRNELFFRALLRKHYDYYLFADDDLQFSFDLALFERFVRAHKPRRAVPCLPAHKWNTRQKASIDRVKYVDHAFMAVRSDCAKIIFPYTLRYDTKCWWLSSEDMCERFWDKWPLETLRFNDLMAVNGEHGLYPKDDYPGLPENSVRAFGRWWWLYEMDDVLTKMGHYWKKSTKPLRHKIFTRSWRGRSGP